MTTPEQTSLDNLRKRLHSVERRSRLMTVVATLPALTLVAVAVMGTSPPKASETRFGTVIAKKFVLEDEDGVVRGSLMLDNPAIGPEFVLGTPGAYNIYMSAGDTFGQIGVMRGTALSPQSFKQIVQLQATDDGPNVLLHDSKGYEAIIGAASLAHAKIGTSTISSAASIHLFGKGGSVLWGAPR